MKAASRWACISRESQAFQEEKCRHWAAMRHSVFVFSFFLKTSASLKFYLDTVVTLSALTVRSACLKFDS